MRCFSRLYIYPIKKQHFIILMEVHNMSRVHNSNKLPLLCTEAVVLGAFSRNFANMIKENLIKSFSRSQMTDIEFSDWYFLFLSPTENRTDVGELTGPREKLPSPSSSVSDEVTRSLSEKLRVPASQFRVGSLEQYRVRF